MTLAPDKIFFCLIYWSFDLLFGFVCSCFFCSGKIVFLSLCFELRKSNFDDKFKVTA